MSALAVRLSQMRNSCASTPSIALATPFGRLIRIAAISAVAALQTSGSSNAEATAPSPLHADDGWRRRLLVDLLELGLNHLIQVDQLLLQLGLPLGLRVDVGLQVFEKGFVGV